MQILKFPIETFRQLNSGEKILVSVRIAASIWIFFDINFFCAECPTLYTPIALAIYLLVTCFLLPLGSKKQEPDKPILSLVYAGLDLLAAVFVFLSVTNPSHLGPFLFYLAVVWSARFMTVSNAFIFSLTVFLVYALACWVKGMLSVVLLKQLIAMVVMGLYVSLFARMIAESERERKKRDLLLKELKKSFQEQVAGALELEKMNDQLKKHTAALEAYQGELVRRNQELGLLTEVLKTTTATLDLHSLLNHTLQKTVELFGVSSAFIVLNGPGELVDSEMVICQEISELESLHLASKVKPLLTETREVLVWRHGVTPPIAGIHNDLLNAGITGFLATPLLVRGEVRGMMALINVGLKDVIKERDFFRIVSSQVSLAIEKAIMYEQMKKQAITDGLTSLYNVRHFHDRLSEEIAKVERKNGVLTLLMIDMDWFKEYNDTYGHQAGDSLLCQAARVLAGNVREGDLVARYGGEEFTVILPDTTTQEAIVLAERLRRRFREVQSQDAPTKQVVTLSIGVATYPDHAQTARELIECADRAMYRAKAMGKDLVCSIDDFFE